MRVVFMGTPDFAVPTLRALSGLHDVVGVFTRPDAVSGRGRAPRPTPVRVVAQELGIPVFTPRTLRDAESQADLVALRPDIIIVAAYGLILPAEVLAAAPLGCVNVHASLLPRWRGAAPIQRAILAGDEVIGVSIMRMEEGLDTGPYCAVASTEVLGKNAVELTHELAQLGASLLVDSLEMIRDGSACWTQQDESLVTYAEKITKPEVALGPGLPADELLRRVRASSPQAPARAVVAGTHVTVTDAAPSDVSCAGGAVCIEAHTVVLGAAEESLAVLSLKPDNKQTMDAQAWARGARLASGDRWESE